MEETIIQSLYSPDDLLPISDILESLNDNILLLLDKIDLLNEIQFNFLILLLSIVVLGIIYSVITKFIR